MHEKTLIFEDMPRHYPECSECPHMRALRNNLHNIVQENAIYGQISHGMANIEISCKAVLEDQGRRQVSGKASPAEVETNKNFWVSCPRSEIVSCPAGKDST